MLGACCGVSREWLVVAGVAAVAAAVAVTAGPPEDRLTVYREALLRETRGTPAEAAAAWRRALDSDPGDLFAWDHLVQILARDGDLPAEIEGLRAQVAAWPAADVPRLRLALALQAAGVPRESIPPLEAVLLDRPASNLAWTFLLDAFGTRQEFDDYAADVAARAAAPDAPSALALLRVRLLLQMGRADEARTPGAGHCRPRRGRGAAPGSGRPAPLGEHDGSAAASPRRAPPPRFRAGQPALGAPQRSARRDGAP